MTKRCHKFDTNDMYYELKSKTWSQYLPEKIVWMLCHIQVICSYPVLGGGWRPAGNGKLFDGYNHSGRY